MYCDNVGGFVPTEMLSDIETGIVRPGPGSNLPSSSILGVTSLHPLSSAPPRPRSQHGPGPDTQTQLPAAEFTDIIHDVKCQSIFTHRIIMHIDVASDICSL